MTIVGALPFTLTNGTTADANQVMADLNAIVSGVNTNAAHNGANSDITSLTGLTTPLSIAQGGTGTTVGAVPKFATIAALRANTSVISSCTVESYATAGDAGAGIFVYVASDNTSADNGGSIIVDASAHRFYRVSVTSLTPQMFGAKGDGVNDDTAAINNAIAAAVGTTGVVFFPHATYLVSSSIVVPSNIILAGGAQAKIIASVNNLTVFTTSGNCFYTQFINLYVDGNTKTGVTAYDLSNFRFGAVMANCQIYNVANGIILRSLCWNTILENPTLQNVTTGIQVLGGSTSAQIRHPAIDASGTTGIVIAAGAGTIPVGVEVLGGFIQGMSSYGINDGGIGTQVSDTYFERCTLADVYVNAANTSTYKGTQHFASTGAVCYLGRNSATGITILSPIMGASQRSTGVLDFDNTCTTCVCHFQQSSDFKNSPIGVLTGILASQDVSGTFTPVVVGTGTAGVGTYTTQSGTYVLQDGVVTFNIEVTWTAHTGTGNITVTGLPNVTTPASFTPRRIANLQPLNIAITGPYAYAYLNGSNSNLTLIQTTAAGVSSLVPIANSGTLYISGSYTI